MGPRPAPITDPTELQAALKTSYATLQQAVGGLSESDLKAAVKMFGRDTTTQGSADTDGDWLSQVAFRCSHSG